MKYIIIFLIFLLINVCESQVKYVTTIHPFQQIVKNITDERAQVDCLLSAGASPHTFELQPSDLLKVEKAWAIIMDGAGLDSWALKFQNSHKIQLITLIPDSILIHTENKRKNSETHHPSQLHTHTGGIDPHFWTDPLAVKSILYPLVDSLCTIDMEGCDIYKANTIQFAVNLDSLNARTMRALASVRNTAVMLTHPFFVYYFKRYGINLVGTIETAPGVEPSPKEIKKIIENVKRLKVKAIFSHPQLSDRSAQIIAEATGIKVYQLDPLGGVKGRQTYEKLLDYNTQIILEALR